MRNRIKPYVVGVLLALAVGGASVLVTKGNMDIYDKIIKPALSPPMWLFPAVWSILFVLMGIGSAEIYLKGKKESDEKYSALSIYALQLAVNFFWSIIFFNMRAYLFAFIWLIVLWVLIVMMIRSFRKISPLAAYLQLPYLLWVTFAGYLTLMIYILNG